MEKKSQKNYPQGKTNKRAYNSDKPAPKSPKASTQKPPAPKKK